MNFLLPALISFLVTVLAVYPTIRLAKKFGLVDNPKKRPHPAHIQNRVIPRAGGLPIFLGIFMAILLFIPLSKAIIGIILATFLLLVVGLLDDYLPTFSPYPRLLFQILAAGLVVASGVGITFIANPLGGVIRLDLLVFQISFLGVHNLIMIADIFALFWIVWMMNTVNWSKGIDGQMPGIITVAALVMGIFSYKLYTQGDPNQLNIALLSFITAGASLAALIFNWYPSKILPAFSGSSILGLMIATLSILSGAKLAVALLVLLVPAVDFFYTFSRRILSGKSPFFGDQKHLHHLLLNRHWSHPKIALFYILGSAILGAAALTLESEGKLFAAALVGIIVLGGIIWLNFFGALSKQPDPDSG